MRDFPDGFLFGSSTAAHQVEGGNTGNDWWAWEHTPGSTAHPSRRASQSTSSLRYPARTSLCWRSSARTPTGSRTSGHASSPRRAKSDPAALDHYRRVLECLARERADCLRHAAPLHEPPRWFAEKRRLARVTMRSSASRATRDRRPANALGEHMPWTCTITSRRSWPSSDIVTGTTPRPAFGIQRPGSGSRGQLMAAHRSVRLSVPAAGVCLQMPEGPLQGRTRTTSAPRPQHEI